MKTKNDPRPLNRKLQGCIWGGLSAKELMSMMVSLLAIETKLAKNSFQPKLVAPARICLTYKDKLKDELQRRRLPDPEHTGYMPRELFAEKIKGVDEQALAVLEKYFDARIYEDMEFFHLAEIINDYRTQTTPQN